MVTRWQVSFVFDMPKWVDVILKKWKLQEYNAVQAEIEFIAEAGIIPKNNRI